MAAWMRFVSNIPMNDLALTRGIHAVAVADQVYLFGYNKSGDEDTVQVLAFHPATSSWKALQPLERGDGSNEDVSDPGGEKTVIDFAVACKERVYVFVGGRYNLHTEVIKVFDTRNSQWSCVRTSGDVPSGLGRWWVRACEYNGRVFMCSVELVGGSSLWALDLSSLRWTIVGTWKEYRAVYRAACLLPYENRLYMLLDEMTGERGCGDYVMMYFDLATHSRKEPNMLGPEPMVRSCWIPFILQEKMYILFRENPSYLPSAFEKKNINESGMNYSFATNTWVQMKFKGITPADTLDLVCVVGSLAIFFCFEKKKAYLLDFFQV